jgi:uncharacterized cupredoxin-like copper-binding protein
MTTLTSKRAALYTLAATGLALFLSPAAHGHGEKAHAAGPVKKEQKDWGIAGTAAQVRRTIAVSMGDDMRFTPALINIRPGETVRFKVANRGTLMHEFVIGTRPELEAHAALMVKFPDMEHDEPYMAHVPAGQTGEIIWTFNRPGEFEFACLIAGHFSAGMKGVLRVAGSPAR